MSEKIELEELPLSKDCWESVNDKLETSGTVSLFETSISLSESGDKLDFFPLPLELGLVDSSCSLLDVEGQLASHSLLENGLITVSSTSFELRHNLKTVIRSLSGDLSQRIFVVLAPCFANLGLFKPATFWGSLAPQRRQSLWPNDKETSKFGGSWVGNVGMEVSESVCQHIPSREP